MASTEQEKDMGGKLAGLSLGKQVRALALWPFLQNLMGVGVGFADMMIAGHMQTGEKSEAIMDMMGVGMYLMWLLMIVQGAMGTGAMALVSRSTGANDMRAANLALGQSLLLGLASGVFSGVMLWVLVPWLGAFFGLSELALQYTVEYMRVVVWLSPFSGVLFVASSCLRGYGDTRQPFYAMLLVNVVNVIASLYLTRVVGMGVDGLAYGTVLGWAIGAVAILLFLLPKSSAGEDGQKLKIRLSHMRYHAPMLRRIWRVSWPSVFEILGMWSVHAVGVYFIGTMAKGTMGAHAMVIRLESLSFMPGFALGMAASTLTGLYLGARRKDMAVKAVRYCWVIALITMGGMGFLVSIFNTEFLSLFGDAGSSQSQVAAPVIRVIGLLQVLTATMMVMKMSMRGAGDTRTVTIYAFLSMGLVRIGGMWSLMKYANPTLLQVWLVMYVDMLLQTLIFTWLHIRGKWLDREV